jgi:hypothetical protein
MILLKYFIAFSLFLIILTACSSEPDSIPIIPIPKATIKGVVRDIDTNEPIYYVTITTIPPSIETQTGINGDFILNDIGPKDYMVYGYIPGFDNDSVLVSLTDGDTANVDLYLNNFDEYLDYYPLDIGNYWEYWHGDSPLFSLEVISDTTISGKIYRFIRYKSLTSQNIDYRYERVDEYNAMVYRYFSYYLKEMIIDSLAAKTGQEFSSNMFFHPDVSCYSICSSIKVEEIFGEPRSIRSLSHACATDLPSYQIIKGLGLYSASFWRAGGYTLKYAIIKGVEYGTKY